MSELPESVPEPPIGSGVGRGWWPIVAALHEMLLEIDPGYRPAQIKEKFGGLRYYADFSDGMRERTELLVRLAERVAARTCEKCGRPGEACTPSGFWRKTLCVECADARRG